MHETAFRCVSTSLRLPVHVGMGRHSTRLTWVGHRGDSDFVVGFTGAEACDNILNPPQLLPDLGFLLLLTDTQMDNQLLCFPECLFVFQFLERDAYSSSERRQGTHPIET